MEKPFPRVIHYNKGRKLTGRVWSLAPDKRPQHTQFRDSETVWAAMDDGYVWWLRIDMRPGDDPVAYEGFRTEQRGWGDETARAS